MAYQKAITANPYKNNGATVLNAGNVVGTNVTKSVTLANTATQYGSQRPVVSSTLGIQKANNSGTFAKMTAGNYVIIGVSQTLAGLTNTTLKASKSFSHNPKHRLTTVNTGFLRALSWTSLNVDLPTYTATQSASTVTMGADNFEGKLTYFEGKPVPVTTTV